MSQLEIYHNPRCSRSRATLALPEQPGVDPQIVEYLDNPLVDAMAVHPILIEGPIVATQTPTSVGWPPQDVPGLPG